MRIQKYFQFDVLKRISCCSLRSGRTGKFYNLTLNRSNLDSYAFSYPTLEG